MKDKADFQICGYPVQFVHGTSGRIRLKAIAPTEAILQALAAQLERLEGVYEVESKIATGSLIIWFNGYRVTALELFENLARYDSTALARSPHPSPLPETSEVLGENCRKIGQVSQTGTVKTGVLRGLRGGTLKCCLAIFARYSLSELVQHSRQDSVRQTPPLRRSVWQKLKAIAR